MSAAPESQPPGDAGAGRGWLAAHRRLVVLVLVAALVLGAAAGIGLSLAHGSPAGAPVSSAASSDSPTSSSGSPSPSASASGGSPTATSDGQAAAAAGLPVGGPVPANFTASSMTTTAGGWIYVLGSAPCATAPCTSVVRSHDGGATWAGVPAPRATLAPAPGSGGQADLTSTVTELRFATPKDGYAFGGALWATHDGGATWKQLRVPGQVSDLGFSGGQVLLALAGCGAGATCPPGQLLAGPQGGGSFTPVASVLPTGPANGATLSVGAAGQATLEFQTSAGTQSYVGSARTWSRLPSSPCQPTSGGGGSASAGPLQVLMPTAGTGGTLFGACANAGAGNVSLGFSRSSDGGHTWAPAGAVRVPNGRLTATASSAQQAVVSSGSVDLGGALEYTADGGRTWASAHTPLQATVAWRWVGAAGGSLVWALPLHAVGTVFRSTDGGRTFGALPIQ